MQSQNRNSDLGAYSQVAVFVFDFILCVQRTHSTALNEINVERPLRHIYELGAWLVTWGRRRQDKFRLCPFFRRNVGTGDRGKLLCTLLPPQYGHR